MPAFSRDLEKTLHRALALANEYRHEYATLEHLLLAMCDNTNFVLMLKAVDGDLGVLRKSLTDYIEKELIHLVTDGTEDSKPTAGFQRVIQRAVIHVQASNREEVGVVNICVAIFAERESQAALLLSDQNITRYDVVNFISHGVSKAKYKEDNSTSGNIIVDKELKIEQNGKFIFISYSRFDLKIMETIKDNLESEALEVWTDQNIHSGVHWRTEIHKQLAQSAVVLVIWSEHSVKSSSVIEEASYGKSKNKLVHILIDDVSLPYGFNETQYYKIKKFGQKENRQILSALHYKLNPPSLKDLGQDIVSSSATDSQIVRGKISIVDRPAGVAPRIVNPVDFGERLRSQLILARHLEMELSHESCNLPNYISKTLKRYHEALSWNKVCWYAIDDVMNLLVHCIDRHKEDDWPGIVFQEISQLRVRHKELESLLRPKQSRQNKAGPSDVTQLNPNKLSDDAIGNIVDKAIKTKNSPEAESVLNISALAAIDHFSTILNDSNSEFQSESDRSVSIHKLRRGLVGMYGVVASVTAAVSAGVAANLLTSAQSAELLVKNLDLIKDMIIHLFV